MEGQVQLMGPVAASFALSLMAMIALRPLAIAVNLIDRPGGRKSHIGEVPVVGGLGMLLGMVLGLGLLPLSNSTAGILLAAFVILVTVGLIDDRFGLSPWTRLPVQMVAAIVIMVGARAVVGTLGAPLGDSEILLEGTVSYAVTMLSIVAAINAYNMLDGMDGLAGALAMVALAALALLAHDGNVATALAISVVIMGAVAAFLLANLPINFNREVRCFMGDSGSMLLGAAVAWVCIAVSQGAAPAAKPVTMLWIVALPLYELSWTVIRRTIRGISPFKPDTGHLHHIVLQAGIPVRAAFVIFVVLAVLLASIGIALDRLGVHDSWSFAFLVGTGAVIIRLLYLPNLLRKLVPPALRESRPAVID
jgi:UDP-GlcNAc:undecaprenyl-phosphate/decaprenyl-phosphate GlcNAc-1-phosphate transferase